MSRLFTGPGVCPKCGHAVDDHVLSREIPLTGWRCTANNCRCLGGLPPS